MIFMSGKTIRPNTNFPGCHHDLTLVTFMLKWKLTEAVLTLGTELVSIMNPLWLVL